MNEPQPGQMPDSPFIISLNTTLVIGPPVGADWPRYTAPCPDTHKWTLHILWCHVARTSVSLQTAAGRCVNVTPEGTNSLFVLILVT
jgi:hypothetical protein